MRQIILDTETTGLDPRQGHRITEIACLEMIDRKLTGRHFQTYLNPEREVDEGAYRITGLNLAFLKDKPTFNVIIPELLTFIEDAELIIHNAPFDVGFLNAELLRHVTYALQDKHAILDTLVMARKLHPGQKNSLDALCKRYYVNNSNRSLHGALIDTELLAKVYLAMTAGQTAFSLDCQLQTAPLDRNVSRPMPIRPNLKVIKANPQELEQHAKRIALINSLTQGKALFNEA